MQRIIEIEFDKATTSMQSMPSGKVGGTRIGPTAIETNPPVWGTSDGFRGLVKF